MTLHVQNVKRDFINIPLKWTALASWFSKCLWMTLWLLVLKLGQRGHPNTDGDTMVHLSLLPLSVIEGFIWGGIHIFTQLSSIDWTHGGALAGHFNRSLVRLPISFPRTVLALTLAPEAVRAQTDGRADSISARSSTWQPSSLSLCGRPLRGRAVVAPSRFHFRRAEMTADRGRSSMAEISRTDFLHMWQPTTMPRWNSLNSPPPIFTTINVTTFFKIQCSSLFVLWRLQTTFRVITATVWLKNKRALYFLQSTKTGSTVSFSAQ